MHSIFKIPLKDQKDYIARESARVLDGKLWSIALSHDKLTLGLETDEQRWEYERMTIKEEEQVLSGVIGGLVLLKGQAIIS